ncbi:cation:dicarboxylate symporter family transporter [Pseudomonas moraviensis]|uniref:cation:dicarboxylate symporter family transporter n=1 Tax=Pseudomonas moraviensis TaxID=321662 RepID=UPI0038241B71
MSRVSECFFEFINLIMKFAPLGAFGLVAYVVGSNGSAVLMSLTNLVLMFYVGVAFFIFVVLGASLPYLRVQPVAAPQVHQG